VHKNYPNSNPERLRSFGRRKTHGLSDIQEEQLALTLDQIGVPQNIDLTSWIDDKKQSYHGIGLEIGFGDGEHFVARAKEFPDIFWIGCEPFINGIVKVADPYQSGEIPNIALHADDARMILDHLPDQCLSRAAILYPDPWHKNKHHKRRIVNPYLIKTLNRICMPNAMVQIASDIPNYINWTLDHFKKEVGFKLISDTPEKRQEAFSTWPGTKYEKKAIREGRTPQYLTYIKI